MVNAVSWRERWGLFWDRCEFTELVGKFILKLGPRNPLRRWFEHGLAETKARRAAWREKSRLATEETRQRIDEIFKESLRKISLSKSDYLH